MEKKGFTLVEVLAVVVILGLLVAIISPIVNNLLGDSEDALYDEQINSVVNATKKYMVEHSELLPEFNDMLSINISDLISNGVIDKDKILNPKTKEELNGCVVISYSNEFNQYEYNYYDIESSVCDSNTMIAYRNVSIGSYYETLEDALSNLRDNGENVIRVVRNVTDASSERPSIPEGKNVLFDLNGHTVTMSNSILNYGTMKIIDSGSNGTLQITGSSNILLYNYKDLEITGGNFNSQYRIIRNANVATIGELTISGGTFTSEGVSGNPYSIQAISLAGGNTTITGGMFIAKKGGSSKNAHAIDLEANTSAQLTINGGAVKSDIYGIVNNGAQTSANIYDGVSVTGISSNAIRNVGQGIVKIYGGTMVSENGDCIYNASTGSIEMYGGSLTGKAAGISLGSGTALVTGGTIQGSTFGIWMNNSNSPALTLGRSDSTIDSVPLITATNPTGNGVYVGTGSTLNYYDGTVIGGYSDGTGYSITKATNGSINPLSGYSISRTNDGSRETAVLAAN